jgi:PAS domain-containing protein
LLLELPSLSVGVPLLAPALLAAGYGVFRLAHGIRATRRRLAALTEEQRQEREQRELAAAALSDRDRELREARRSLETLISNLPGLVYRCRHDRQRTMERIEGECYDLTGYHPPDLVGNRNASYGELIHPSDRERVWREVHAAVTDEKAFRCTYRIRNADGEERWVWE